MAHSVWTGGSRHPGRAALPHKNIHEAIVNAEGYSFHILFGSKTGGNFLCIPGWRMGCELSYLSDVFWNQRSILGDDQRFGYENATAVAYALKKLKDVIE